MNHKIRMFVHYTRKNGIFYALKLATRSVGKKVTPPQTGFKKISVMAKIDDIIAADFVNKPYIRPAPVNKNRLSIAWVLSPISAGSGGQNTIARFARSLQDAGHEVRFYIYEGIHLQSAGDARSILHKHFGLDVDVRSIDKYQESDVVIATGWETAYPVFNLETKAHKYYFVQDFEPAFYGLGSMAVLAENTYKMGFYGITAGKWLAHKLSSEYGMDTDYFNFGVDIDVYKPSTMPRKIKKACFYARPVTERRAFELGVMALGVFHKKHPEYQIEFFGWDTSEYDIPFPYTNRGVLSHEELAELYQESAACLVLSLTNVSLLPLELLAAGCIPVMNDGDNNRLVLGKNDNILYTGYSPVQLAQGLCAVVENNDLQTSAEKASRSVANLSWGESYEKVEAIILKETTNARS
jgi:O-antigen biosynthesis protein